MPVLMTTLDVKHCLQTWDTFNAR